MRVLVTNDDGINAPGIQVLEKIAATLDLDIWVVAPEVDQSGASHSLTLAHPLRIRQISEKRFAVNGTPTDCVMAAVNLIMRDKPPVLVLSGVNYGGNLAEDVLYSGTVAAAMEGAILGLPAVAMSLAVTHGDVANWENPLKYGPKILKQLLDMALPSRLVLNLNFPAIPMATSKVKITFQGHRKENDQLIERTDPRGKKYYWIGAVNYSSNEVEGSDLDAINNNCISITPLAPNLTNANAFNTLTGIFHD